ncbi:ATP-binding protein [Terricaulis sp.]|uniref:sensor histidine kinase n=1 Tax=Terricaulis sp. TaxID=2768686 RepID=UPI003783969A
MRPRLDALLRTTTFRLAIVQVGVVLAFVVCLLAYIYFATVGQLKADADVLVEQEYAALDRAYSEGGRRRLNQEVVERAALQGPMLYVLAEADGTVITGDFQTLPRQPSDDLRPHDLDFDSAEVGGAQVSGHARAKVGRLLGGPILMVARDLGDSAAIAGRITQALWTVAVLGILGAAASGLLAGWQAARRAGALSATAREVMAGDLTRRAPVRGVGDEFDTLAEDMNAMLERIEKLVQTTRTAGDAIAHDLRSPLTRFRQKLESALEAPPDTDSDRAALTKAVAEADRLLDMFAAVLKLARVESAGNWRFERVDLSEVLKELVEFYEPAAEEQGLTLKGDVGEGLAVRGDEGLVTQAVSNLIENALKYTPVGGKIELRARKNGAGRLDIAVLDDGPGIPPADRDRVLERFVRLETARSTPGVGLGLSLVSAVARLHRGALKLGDGLANAQAGCGLSASLDLPAADAAR